MRRAATDIDGSLDLTSPAATLSLISVRTILPLAQRVRRMLLAREEMIDEARSPSATHDIVTVSALPSAADSDTATQTLEPSRSVASAADRATSRPTDPAHPPTGNERREGDER